MFLMHKNDIVASFGLYNGRPSMVTKIYRPDLLPAGMGQCSYPDDADILSWYMSRSVPVGRSGYDRLKDALGDYCSMDEALLMSFGISLTDTYWFKLENSDMTWDSLDPHDNSFSSDLLNIRYDLFEKPGISPDYTTNGTLEKFWTLSDGDRLFIKSGEFPGITNGTGVLAANEVAAGRIAQSMGIDAVEYGRLTLPGIKDDFCCSKCFTKDDEDLVTGADLMRLLGTEDCQKTFEYISELGFETEIRNMVTLDVLLHNTDRHSENYGVIYDADTIKPVRFAPIYDTGACLGWTGRRGGMMKFPLQDRKTDLRYINNEIKLPEKEYFMHILDEVYDMFKIPHEQKILAGTELSEGWDMLYEALSSGGGD